MGERQPHDKRRLRARLKPLLTAAGALLLLECSLRLFAGRPLGLFLFLDAPDRGLYPRNARIQFGAMPLPWTVETNSLGLRGDEAPFRKQPGVFRIASVGDSFTEGFCVDNHSTYPYYLQQVLRTRTPHPVEVLNCAKGGGSIDWEFAVLKEVVTPLRPDLVVLTFYANDISDLVRRKRKTLMARRFHRSPAGSALSWAMAHTAIGETTTDLLLRVRFRAYRQQRGHVLHQDPEALKGSMDHPANLRVFYQRFETKEGLVLREPFTAETEHLIDNYVWMLEHVADYCQQHGWQLVFAYYPAYPQVYESEPVTGINDRLRTACQRLHVPFVDATEGFRRRGRTEQLYLAPLDFHGNPKGNHAMAEIVADFLVGQGLVPGED